MDLGFGILDHGMLIVREHCSNSTGLTLGSRGRSECGDITFVFHRGQRTRSFVLCREGGCLVLRCHSLHDARWEHAIQPQQHERAHEAGEERQV